MVIRICEKSVKAFTPLPKPAIFLHSLFPPRINLNDYESVGRSCILFPVYYKANHRVLSDTELREERKEKTRNRYSQTERGYAWGDTSKQSIWNWARVDWGTFIIEIFLLLSAGGVVTTYLKLKKQQSEQAVAHNG